MNTDILMTTAQAPREYDEIERLVQKSFEIGKNKRWQENRSLHYEGPGNNASGIASDYRGRFCKFSEGPPYRRMVLGDALKEEHRFFCSVSDYSYIIEDLRIDIFGNTAISTFIIEQTGRTITQPKGENNNSAKYEEMDNAIIERTGDPHNPNTLCIRARGTMMFVNFASNGQESPRWLIVHEHFSRVASRSNH